MKKIIFAVILICLIVFVNNKYGNPIITFMESETFTTIDIKLNGNFLYTKEEIVDKILPYKGKSLVYIDTKRLENTIKQDIRIENVKVKKYYPSTLSVTINEKEFIGIYFKENEKYMLDKNLDLIITYDEKIEVDDKNSKKKQEYMIIDFDENTKKEAKILVENLIDSKIYPYISEIYKQNNVWTLVLKNNIKVFTNEKANTKKYDFAYQLNNDEIITDYIDIRFDDITTK